MEEKVESKDSCSCDVIKGNQGEAHGTHEVTCFDPDGNIKGNQGEAHGTYEVTCFDPDGNIKWEDKLPNVVCTVGKNYMLTQSFVTANAIVGPFVGLISNQSYTAVAAGDTMASHAGWVEAGNANTPTYSGTRITPSWAAAGSGNIAFSANANFSITGAGIVAGCFIVYGTGASNANGNTSGILWSAGLFTSGNKSANNGDTVSVSYSTGL
jgi:hypothetical protein